MNNISQGKDLHKELASKMFGVPVNEVTSEQREKAKSYNFLFMYGYTGAPRKFSEAFLEVRSE